MEKINSLVSSMQDSRIFVSFSSRLMCKRDVLLEILQRVSVVVISPEVIEKDLRVLGINGTETLKVLVEEMMLYKKNCGKVEYKNELEKLEDLFLKSKSCDVICDDVFSYKNNKILFNVDNDILVHRDMLIITPSHLLFLMGFKLYLSHGISSLLGLCYFYNVRVYCPLLTEINLFDIYSCPLIIDAVMDIYSINLYAMRSPNTSGIVLSTGLYKHHVLNANLFKEGLDRCLIVNTAVEYDATDSGASVEEAVTWGKIKPGTKSIKIDGEAQHVVDQIHKCMSKWK